jgi:Cu2+-containing amine oxidase
MKAAKPKARAAKLSKTAKANAKKPAAGRRSAAAKPPRRAAAARQPTIDPRLFDPLTEGERADALRILTEDRRVAQMAKVARYRVIAVEPLVVKSPHPLVGRRAARIVIYDYASDRCVEAAIDLDDSSVAQLAIGGSQPMLSRDEEAAAAAIALGDERVKRELALGDCPQAAMHYWSRRESEVAFRRRCAAVLLGQPGDRPSWVAVVDLVDAIVLDLVPATQW